MSDLYFRLSVSILYLFTSKVSKNRAKSGSSPYFFLSRTNDFVCKQQKGFFLKKDLKNGWKMLLTYSFQDDVCQFF